MSRRRGVPASIEASTTLQRHSLTLHLGGAVGSRDEPCALHARARAYA